MAQSRGRLEALWGLITTNYGFVVMKLGVCR